MLLSESSATFRAMKFLLPIAAMICTVISTLTAVVFCLGMGANSTPAQIRMLKLWMLALSLIGIIGILAGVYIMRSGGQNTTAATVAFLPTVIFVLILIIALVK